MTATHRDAQTGFTLVELAIVLIIIGLLIGGTLKGQELINGARTTATVSQIRAIQAGALTFLDAYKGFPGDLPSAEVKLPNCSSTNGCAVTSGGPEIANARGGTGQVVGNGTIDFGPGNRARVGQENVAFFVQMFAADLIDGISATNQTAGAAGVVGVNILGSKLGSGSYFRVGYVARPAEMPNTMLGGNSNGRAGHFLALMGGEMPMNDTQNVFGGATGSIDGTRTIGQDAIVQAAVRGKGIPTVAAQRVDSKFDDGNPNTGAVMATNTDPTVTSNTCALRSAGAKDYNTANRNNDCVIYALFAP